MVRHPDDASFLSWTDTLRPGSAAGNVSNPGGNAWVTVYYEVVAEVDDDRNNMMYPVATDVVMVDGGQQEDIESLTMPSMSENVSRSAYSPTSSSRLPERNSLEVGTEDAVDDHHYRQPKGIRRQPWRHSNLLDLIVGLCLSVTAVVFTFKMEICSMLIYFVGVAFHYLAEEVFSSSVCVMLRAIFYLVTGIMMFVDSVLLVTNVLVTEILGFTALFVCSLFGGTRSGTEWHQ